MFAQFGVLSHGDGLSTLTSSSGRKFIPTHLRQGLTMTNKEGNAFDSCRERFPSAMILSSKCPKFVMDNFENQCHTRYVDVKLSHKSIPHTGEASDSVETEICRIECSPHYFKKMQ